MVDYLWLCAAIFDCAISYFVFKIISDLSKIPRPYIKRNCFMCK